MWLWVLVFARCFVVLSGIFIYERGKEKFCTDCGKRFSRHAMNCPRCGRPNRDGWIRRALG